MNVDFTSHIITASSIYHQLNTLCSAPLKKNSRYWDTLYYIAYSTCSVIVKFSRIFKNSLQSKRRNKSFFKNIFFKVNSWPAKIRSVQTYEVLWIYWCDPNCIFHITVKEDNKNVFTFFASCTKEQNITLPESLSLNFKTLLLITFLWLK